MADDLKGRKPAEAEVPLPARRPYARPQITWRESYEPSVFGVSCLRQPGNPGCNPGPTTT